MQHAVCAKEIQILKAFVISVEIHESSFQFPFSSCRTREVSESIHHINPAAFVS